MTATRLTPKDVYELYLRVWPDDDPWPLDGKPDQRQLDIVAEVRAMRAAPSLDAACDVVAWWTGLGGGKQLRRDLARLRRMTR